MTWWALPTAATGSETTTILVGGWSGLACGGAAHCVAVGSVAVGFSAVGATVAFHGGTAGDTQMIAGTYDLHDVACGSAGTCEAVGRTAAHEGVVVAIRNGLPGPAQVVAGASDLTGVACPSARTCWAVGGPPGASVAVSIDRGVPGPVVPVAGDVALRGIACPTVNLCQAVGQSLSANVGVIVSIARGDPTPVSGTVALTSIACASTTACTAVGEARRAAAPDWGVVVPVTRGAAGKPEGVPGTLRLDNVACGAPTSCEAVGIEPPTDLSPGTASVLVPIASGSPGPARDVSEVVGVLHLACVNAAVCEALVFAHGGQLALTPVSPPPIFHCATTLTGTRRGSLRLARGSTCLSGLTLAGGIHVSRGASLDVEGATVSGSITAVRPSRLRICGSVVGGSVGVAAAARSVVLGDPGGADCAVNRIAGSLAIERSSHGVEIVGNRVGGRVTASGNHSTPAPRVADNDLLPPPCTNREAPVGATSWPTDRPSLAPGGASAVRLCRYAAASTTLGPTAPRPLVSSTLVTERSVVDAITDGFSRLPPPPAEDDSVGRFSDGSEIVALVAYPDGRGVFAGVDFTGCAFVTSGAATVVASGADGQYGPQLVAQLEQLTGYGGPLASPSLYAGCPA